MLLARLQSSILQNCRPRNKTLICNRPDGEGADQPNVIEIEEAAQRHGLNVIYQPVTSGKITDQQVTEFKQLYQNAQNLF